MRPGKRGNGCWREDFRPLLAKTYTTGDSVARLLLVSPRRFPRGTGDRSQVIVRALTVWLSQPDVAGRPNEDWLVGWSE